MTDIDKLEKLHALKDKGVITEEEFIIEKRKILDSNNTNTPPPVSQASNSNQTQIANDISHVKDDDNISVGSWMLTLFLCSIPFLNIIILFGWSFDSDVKTVKANFAKAMLLWILISVVFYFFLLYGLGVNLYYYF